MGLARNRLNALEPASSSGAAKPVEPATAAGPKTYEFETLILHVEKAGEAYHMTGADRAMVYRMAAGTGLRVGELTSLTPESFDLKDGVVHVNAAYSKRKTLDLYWQRQSATGLPAATGRSRFPGTATGMCPVPPPPA